MTDKQRLVTLVQAFADAHKTGNPFLIQAAGEPLQKLLQALPDTWIAKTEEPSS